MTIAGGYTALDVLTAANMNLLPAGVEGGGYASVTADQGSITTVADLTSLTVTFTAVAGRMYKITGKIGYTSTVVGDMVNLFIRDGSSANVNYVTLYYGVANEHGGTVIAYTTPSAGSTTYKLSMSRSGSGTATMRAGAGYPAFILVEDIGPA